MGADLIRWMFCRHNPASNINFGPGPAEELQRQVHPKAVEHLRLLLQLRPAGAGGFDLSEPAVPVGQRPDIDRWILSDLQKLIGRRARRSRTTT